jgi:hypothetical protein
VIKSDQSRDFMRTERKRRGSKQSKDETSVQSVGLSQDISYLSVRPRPSSWPLYHAAIVILCCICFLCAICDESLLMILVRLSIQEDEAANAFCRGCACGRLHDRSRKLAHCLILSDTYYVVAAVMAPCPNVQDLRGAGI